MKKINEYRDYIKNRENPVIFDKNGEFVYFPVNKVMQTTIARNLLSKRCIVYKDNPKLWLEYFEKTDFDNIYKFGIIRNPADKFESAFNYLKKNPRLSKRLKINNLNINDFVKTKIIKYDNPYNFNSHFEKQYEGFFYNNNILVDDLIKLENINDINNLFNKLEIENNEIFNKTEHLSVLTDESIEIIKKIYINDYKFLYKNN